MTKRRLLLSTLFASALLPLAGANAAFETFTDETEFMSRFSSPSEYIQEDFTSLDGAERSSTHTFNNYPGSSLSFTVSTTETTEMEASNAIWTDFSSPDGPWIGTEETRQPITLDFGEEGVRAVGGAFFLTNFAGDTLSESLYVSINGGIAFQLFDLVSDSRPFFGIWTTGPDTIKTLTFSTDESQYVTMANLTVAPVPEPSTYAFVGASMLALLSLKARRATRKA